MKPKEVGLRGIVARHLASNSTAESRYLSANFPKAAERVDQASKHGFKFRFLGSLFLPPGGTSGQVPDELMIQYC